MAYKDIFGSSSQQPFDRNNSSSAPPPYEPDSNDEFPATEKNNNDSSRVSSEDGSDLGPSDDDILAQATEFVNRAQPPPYRPLALAKPVAVPQTAAGVGKPFVRCWSPDLTPYNITESDFVAFIDNLNVVATAFPPLQVLSLVGNVLGMVPFPFAGLVGLGVTVLAKLGTVAVSKSRTDTYMKAVNKNFFAPRGLKATIADRDAMAVTLKLPDGAGSLAPLTDENLSTSMVERRLESLKPYMAELRFDVPPPMRQTTVLAKMSARQVRRQEAKAEKKAGKWRGKQAEFTGRGNDKQYEKESKEQRKYEKEMRKLDEEVKKAAEDAAKDARKGRHSAEKAGRKLGEELAKIEEERRKVKREFGYDMGDSESKAGEEDKENKQAMKALWILIENL